MNTKDMHLIFRWGMLVSLIVALFWAGWSLFWSVPEWTPWFPMSNEGGMLTPQLSRWLDIPCVFLGLAIWCLMSFSCLPIEKTDDTHLWGFFLIAAPNIIALLIGAFSHLVIFLGVSLLVLLGAGVIMFFHFCWVVLLKPFFSQATAKESFTSFFRAEDI